MLNNIDQQNVEQNGNLIKRISRQRLFPRLSIPNVSFSGNSPNNSPKKELLLSPSRSNNSSPKRGSLNSPTGPRKSGFFFNEEFFKLDVCMGSGFSAKVYACTSETNPQEKLALKLFKKKTRGTHQVADIAQITAEVQILQSLSHRRIVACFGVVETPTEIGLLMEYCSGCSLKQLLNAGGRLSEAKAAFYIYQVLEGLRYLHGRGIVHKDIKAANVLLDANDSVKLSDFGISQVVSKSKHLTVLALQQNGSSVAKLTENEEEQVAGAAYWCAPELVLLHEATPAADIWSLGCLVIELLTGNPPYADRNSISALFFMVHDDRPPFPTYISTAAANFLTETFQKDPQLRSDASALSNHLWLAPLASGTEPLFDPADSDILRVSQLPSTIYSHNLRSPSVISSAEPQSFISDSFLLLKGAPSSPSHIPDSISEKLDSRQMRLVNSNSTLINQLKRNDGAFESYSELPLQSEVASRSSSVISSSSVESHVSDSSSLSSFLVTKPHKVGSTEFKESKSAIEVTNKADITKAILETTSLFSKPDTVEAGIQCLSVNAGLAGVDLNAVLEKAIAQGKSTALKNCDLKTVLVNLATAIMSADSNDNLYASVKLAELCLESDRSLQELWCHLGMIRKLGSLCHSKSTLFQTKCAILTLFCQLCTWENSKVIGCFWAAGMVPELVLLIPAFTAPLSIEALCPLVSCLKQLITRADNALVLSFTFALANSHMPGLSLYYPGKTLCSLLFMPLYADCDVVESDLIELALCICKSCYQKSELMPPVTDSELPKALMFSLGRHLKKYLSLDDQSARLAEQDLLIWDSLLSIEAHAHSQSVLLLEKLHFLESICNLLDGYHTIYRACDLHQSKDVEKSIEGCILKSTTLLARFLKMDPKANVNSIRRNSVLCYNLVNMYLERPPWQRSPILTTLKDDILDIVFNVFPFSESGTFIFHSHASGKSLTQAELFSSLLDFLLHVIEFEPRWCPKSLEALHIWLSANGEQVEPMLLRKPFVSVLIRLYHKVISEKNVILDINTSVAGIIDQSTALCNQLAQFPFVQLVVTNLQLAFQRKTKTADLVPIFRLIKVLGKSPNFKSSQQRLSNTFQKLLQDLINKF